MGVFRRRPLCWLWQFSLLLARRRPPQTGAKGLFIELSLHRVNSASVIEPKHLIVQIPSVGYDREPLGQRVRTLDVDLEVRVE
jgi:hypothetical protein